MPICRATHRPEKPRLFAFVAPRAIKVFRILNGPAIELATTEFDDSSPLLDAEVSESDDAHAIGLKLQNTISNVLSETLNLLDMQQVLGVVDALRHCHSVYIFGVGSSGITALDMKHKLMRIGLRGDAVSNNHFMYMQATLLKAGDVAMVSVTRAHRQKQCIHSDWPDRLAPPLSPLPIIWVLHYVKRPIFA